MPGDGAEHSGQRRDAVNAEIRLYARRCSLMSRAVTTGLVSAILFLLTLIGGAADAIFPHRPVIGVLTTCAAILALGLVMIAAVLVIVENIGTPNQIRKELADIPDISGRSSTRSTKLAG